MKSILITGCSSGIGLDSALAFRDAGWKVIASCRKPADCAMMRDHHKIHSICIDYEDETSIIKGFADALEFTGGHLDVLFNNGAYGIPALVEDLPTDALRAIFEANFFGWHTLSRLAIAQMRKQKQGRIIQNSSVLGFAPLKFRGAYNATKFALEGLTDTMRIEMRLLHGVEMGGVFVILNAGVQIRSAAEPPGMRGPEHARVHVNGGGMWVLHVGDQRNAGGPEPRVLGHAGDALACRHGLLGAFAQRAVDGRDIDADLFEHAPAPHHRHKPAARVRAVLGLAFGFFYFEASRACVSKRAGVVTVLQRLKSGYDIVAQLAEPG